MTSAQSAGATHIAVIGMAGRFPGAANLDEFWANLTGGVESLRTFSRAELLASGEDAARLDDPGYVPVQGVLDDATGFDAGLFGYSPREAMLIDPQQRVFLECAWHALDDAGYNPRGYAGSIGVYGGCSLSSYAFRLWLEGRAALSSLDEYQVSIATAPDHLVSRVSYKLGLTGPSITVMTTCSTSLVAIHQAAQSLLGGECDIALAGGASVDAPPRGYLYREGGTLSPDGHVRAFDAGAAGMVGGDGVGIVVLKRLDEALADGDRVRAVLRSSVVGNLGAHRAGYTAPSVAGQAAVIRTALRLAEVDAATIGYVEAHGTGTRVGDPIELAALTRVFRADTDKVGFCAVGSVKTNIGHTDAAAGVASFIKTVLALENRQIPPSLHFAQANPEIDFTGSPFFVSTTLREWYAEGVPRRAGVSSFGLGGTNAHAVLEEAPLRPPAGPGRSRQLLVVSAATAQALQVVTGNLAGRLPGEPLDDVAYTLQVGRQALPYRRFVVCADQPGAIDALARPVSSPSAVRGRKVVFLFPGEGLQHGGMARSLYEQIPGFREDVGRCAETLGLDLPNLLYPSGDYASAATRLSSTTMARPVLFTIEYALARMFMAWGVTPSAMLGNDVGELVAACLAGVFTLPDALKLAATPERPIQNLPEFRFGDRLDTVLADGDPLLVELGPGQSLTALARQAGGGVALAVLHSASDPGDDLETVLAALGQMWLAGNDIDWQAMHAGQHRLRVCLPAYPFERQEYVLPALRPAVNAQSPPPALDGVPGRVAALFGAVLGIATVPGDADFFDLGGDSLTATQLIARTRDAFSVAVPLDSVFDHPTPDEFAEAVARLLARQDAS